MPRTRTQNEKLREDRRRSVLEAATIEFARNGFAGTSTAAVARAAGVSHGTVFVYFGSKEELFRAAVLEPLAPSLRLVEQVLQAPGTPRERVEHLGRVMLASFARAESYLRLTRYVSGQRERFPEVAGELVAFALRTVELLAGTIAEGQSDGQFLPGDPEHLAMRFYAFINGCGLMYRMPPEDPIWADAFSGALRLVAP